MPLPGGSSDKAGNRYELLWTVDRLIDLVLGRAKAIRIEPPNLEGIEFRLKLEEAVEVHQVKRGNSAEGRWSISRLRKVLETFKVHLLADAAVTCVFVSGDGVVALGELADRARAAESHDEYEQSFLSSKVMRSAHTRLVSVWNLNAEETWSFLRRTRFETIDEPQLRAKLLQLLELLFSGPARSVQAVLSDLVLESTHATLTAEDILRYLDLLGITRVPIAPVSASPDLFQSPSPGELVGRDELIQACLSGLVESPTLILVGPSGIGKSCLAARLCNEALYDNVAWLDCSTVIGIRGALSIVNALASCYSDDGILELLRQPHAPTQAIGHRIAALLNRHHLLLVWDALQIEQEDAAILEAIGTRLCGSAQMVTSTDVSAIDRSGWSVIHEVSRLSNVAVIKLFKQLAGIRPSRQLLNLVHGHPYLIQLAARAKDRLSDSDAGAIVRGKGGDWLTAKVLSSLDVEQRDILERCSVYRTGFKAEWVTESLSEREHLRVLAMLHLVVVGQGERYAVHNLIRELVEQELANTRRSVLHRLASTHMAPGPRSTMLELREYGYHTLNAGLANEALRVLAALVNYAVGNGQWAIVLDLTDSLTETNAGEGWSLIWYQRGRGLRLMGETEGALRCYRLAQDGVPSSMAHYPKFEEASMLSYLGKVTEARAIYEHLLEEEATHAAVQARVALALLAGREDGDYDAARVLLFDAVAIARREGYLHARLQAEQVWGRLALGHDRIDEAHEHLNAAYAARMECASDTFGSDLIGWHDLYRCLVEVETRRSHRPATLGAARGLLKFSMMSGNPLWIAEATYEYCSVTEESDEDAQAAVGVLQSLLQHATSEEPLPVLAGYLAAALWSLGEYEGALRTFLDLDREGERLIVPVVFTPEVGEVTESGEAVPGYWVRAILVPPMWVFRGADMEQLNDVLSTLEVDYPESTRILMQAISPVEEPTQ